MTKFLSKYGAARHIFIPVIKRGVLDFAVGADWIPAVGDVKFSQNGGVAGNVTNLPVAIAMGNGAVWDFLLSATEMQAAQVVVTIVDAATKAVEDQSFVLETYGYASAQHEIDLDLPLHTDIASIQSSLGVISGFIDVEISTILALLSNRIATAQSATASTITLDAAASAVDDYYKDCLVLITTGTGAAQSPRLITGYVGSTKVATVFPPWSTNPTGTSVFAILPATQADHAFVRSGLIATGASTGGTLDSGASSVNDFYNDCWIFITGGTGAGQARLISDYVALDKTFVVSPNWITVPSGGSSQFLILPAARAAVADKTGFSLAATGLDAVAAPADVTTDADSRSSFIKMVRALFNRFYNQVTQDETNQKVYNDSATLVHTMPVSVSAGVQTKGKGS